MLKYIKIRIVIALSFCFLGLETCKIRDCDLDNDDLQASLQIGNKLHFCRIIKRYLSCIKETSNYCGASFQYLISSVMISYGSYMPGCNIDPVKYFVRSPYRGGSDDDDDDDEDDEDEGGHRNSNGYYGDEEEEDEDERYSQRRYKPTGLYDEDDDRFDEGYTGGQTQNYQRDDMYDDIEERGYGIRHFQSKFYQGNKPKQHPHRGTSLDDFYAKFGLTNDFNLYNNYGLKNSGTNPRIRPKIAFPENDGITNSNKQQIKETGDDLHDDLYDDLHDDKVLLKSKVRINKQEENEKKMELDDLYDDKYDDKIPPVPVKSKKNGVKPQVTKSKNQRKDPPQSGEQNVVKSLLTSMPKASPKRQNAIYMANGGIVNSAYQLFNLLPMIIMIYIGF